MENASQINATDYASRLTSGIRTRVVDAIKQASELCGVDFSYLLSKAEQESSLNPTAKASSSSATGLYQFIDQTWLQTIKQCGDKYGLGALADKITIGADGTAQVKDTADKKAILALRNNPEIAATMAAELTKANQQTLENKVGGEIGSTELYLAHFLGAGGASDFLKTMKNCPNAKAASVLPQAAASNKSVFYDTATGRARSVSEIYDRFAAKFDETPSATETQVASADQVEKALASEIAFSSLRGRSSSSVHFSNGVTLGTTTSTPMATMMLAQMDMEMLGLEAMADMDFPYGETSDRKSLSSILAGVG